MVTWPLGGSAARALGGGFGRDLLDHFLARALRRRPSRNPPTATSASSAGADRDQQAGRPAARRLLGRGRRGSGGLRRRCWRSALVRSDSVLRRRRRRRRGAAVGAGAGCGPTVAERRRTVSLQLRRCGCRRSACPSGPALASQHRRSARRRRRPAERRDDRAGGRVGAELGRVDGGRLKVIGGVVCGAALFDVVCAAAMQARQHRRRREPHARALRKSRTPSFPSRLPAST